MRTDEGRADRIAEAALAIIRANGVDGLTHRAVATEADVPLGSTTYHFSSREEILEAAFRRAVNEDRERVGRWVNGLPESPDMPHELARLVLRHAKDEPDTFRAYYELSVMAIERPRLQPLAEEWAHVMTDAVERYLPTDTAEAVSVVYDGILLRVLGTGGLPSQRWIESIFRRACV